MRPDDLQKYLHAKIPLAHFMQVSVVSLTAETVELSAPLEPNLNVHGTFFAGSGASLGLLAAWSLSFLGVQRDKLGSGLVARTHQMSYRKPIKGTVTALASFKEADAWNAFVSSVRNTRRGRITIEVALKSEGHLCATLTVEFAVGRDA